MSYHSQAHLQYTAVRYSLLTCVRCFWRRMLPRDLNTGVSKLQRDLSPQFLCFKFWQEVRMFSMHTCGADRTVRGGLCKTHVNVSSDWMNSCHEVLPGRSACRGRRSPAAPAAAATRGPRAPP